VRRCWRCRTKPSTHPDPAPGSRLRLDEILPQFDVSKSYRLAIASPAEDVFRAVKRYDMRESATARGLMWLRGYGRRVSRPTRPEGLLRSLERSGFVPLGEVPGRELVFGLIGKFWTLSGGLRSVAAEDFAGFHEEGFAKAAWNLAVIPISTESSVLSTETRVLCFGTAARRRFRVYWATIQIFSGLIRMAMLRGIRRRVLAGGGEREKEPHA